MIVHWLLLIFWYNPLWWPESHPGYALGSSWVGVNAGMFTIWYTLWKRHNCHHAWCPRIGRNTLDKDGHHQMYCHKHVEEHK